MNSIMTHLLALSVSEKAAFIFSVLMAVNEATKAIQGGVDSTVDFAYKYLPAKYQAKASEDELKDVVRSFIDVYNKVDVLFKK